MIMRWRGGQSGSVGGGEVIHLCKINATAMWKKTSVSQEVRVRLEVVQHEAVKTCIPARGVYGREGSIMNSSSTLQRHALSPLG